MTKSLSNLYKNQINQHKRGIYTRVIDHNELLEQKLSALSFEQETKLRRQRMAEARQRALSGGSADGDPADGNAGQPQQDGFSECLFEDPLAIPPELEIDYVERAKEKAERIVSKATADAEVILKRAAQEAENLKENARKQAEEKGYAQAMERVQTEESKMRSQLEYMRQEQERSYARQLDAMEPELMDAVIEVFDRVLRTDFARRRKILLHLIRQTVQHIKNSREFRIRVSEEDYETVSAGREEILKKIGGDVILDVIMDESLIQGQCTIDTDEGIFECGIDAQLENLTRDLRALSCMN